MTIRQSLKPTLGILPIISRLFPSYENQTALSAPAAKIAALPKSKTGIQKIQAKLSDFVYLKTTGSGILLKQDQVIKAFSILTATLMAAYLTLYYTLFVVQPDVMSKIALASPLAISVVLLVAAFLVLSGIKKEFVIYQQEIKSQKEMLEKKNQSLESLVSFSEQQREKLKRTVMLKEKLISVITHDIRVPLNSFKMLINNYEKGYMTDDIMINGIIETKKDITKIDNMILDLVNWSRNDAPSASQQTITSQNFAETLDSTLSLYNLCAKTKNLEFVRTIDIPANMCMSIPKRELEIVVRNLVSNAIKYSNPGNKIMIGIKAEPGMSSIATLSVKDFGKGIHPSTLKRLAGNKVTSSLGTLDEVGLGVGLSIVFDVINSNSLQYDIQSEVNKGTEFSVSIPLVTCGK